MSLVRWIIQTETQLMQIPDSAKRRIRELSWGLDSLQGPTTFINLTALYIIYYDGPDLAALSPLVNLTRLYLGRYKGSDLAALSALVSLTYLYLRNYVRSVDVDILCRSRPDIKIHFFFFYSHLSLFWINAAPRPIGSCPWGSPGIWSSSVGSPWFTTTWATWVYRSTRIPDTTRP
jgi:hypothetical protein